MEAIISALEEERREAEKLVARYECELDRLPKGSFFVRTLGNGQYGYMTRSVDGKVQQEYLGKLSEAQIKKYRAQMERVAKVKALLKSAKENVNFLKKALRHADAKGKRGS